MRWHFFKKKKTDLNVNKQNKSFEIHLHLHGDLPAFNKRHLCQNFFLSLMLLLTPHSSAIFPSPPQHLMSRGALKTEVSKSLTLPIVLSMCCDHCPCLPMHFTCWEPMQQKLICQTNGGTAALQDWLLALALKVSKARFYHEFGAKHVLGGLLPPRVHMAVSSLALHSWVTASRKQLSFVVYAWKKRTELQQCITIRKLQSKMKQRGAGLGLESDARKGRPLPLPGEVL